MTAPLDPDLDGIHFDQRAAAAAAFTERLAAFLCADAATHGYDHGANPTLVSFDPAYCPRHLAMAAALEAARCENERLRLRLDVLYGALDGLVHDGWSSLSERRALAVLRSDRAAGAEAEPERMPVDPDAAGDWPTDWRDR